ncbi:Uncharacterised protein [Mycobacterium tuberculosis]|nr:Uncharacterised protein [Mycobacterium tuberculosis]
MPFSIMTAIAQLTSVIVLPDRWIVAHNGITKSAIFSLMPFFLVWRRVTGIVAADDCVPIAVKYAGIIFFSIVKGFFRPICPATEYCTSR